MYNSMTINQTASSQGAAQSLLTTMKPRASSAMLSNRRYYYQKSGIDSSSYGHSSSNSISNQDSYSYNLPKLFGGSAATDGTAASATKTITFEGNNNRSSSSSSTSYDPSPSIVPQPTVTASDSAPVPTISSSPPVGGGFQHLSATIPGAGSALPRAQSASGYRKSIPISSLFSQTNNSVGVVSNSNSSSLGVVGGYGGSVTGRPPLGNSAGPLHSTRAMLVRPSSGSVSRSTVTTGSMSISTPAVNAPQASVQQESRSSPYSTYNASKLQLQSILKKNTANAIDRPAGTQQDSGLNGGPSKGPGGSPHESPLLDGKDKESGRRKVVFAHPLTSSHPLPNPFEFQSLASPSSGRRGEASSPMMMMPQGAKTARGPYSGPTAADAVLSSSNAKMMESSSSSSSGNSNSNSKESGTGSSSSSSSSSPPVPIGPPPSGSPLTQHPPVKSGGFPSSTPLLNNNTNSNAAPLYRVMSAPPAAVGGIPSSTSSSTSSQQQQSIRSSTPPLDVDICEAVSGPVENSRPADDMNDSSSNSTSINAQKKLFVKISRDDGISVQINAGGSCDSNTTNSSSSDDRAAMSIAHIMRLESFSSDVGDTTETACKTVETAGGAGAPPNTTANSVSTDRDRDSSKPRADYSTLSVSVDSSNSKKPASSAAAISLLIEAAATKDKQTATTTSSSSSSSKRKSSSFRPSLSDQLAQIGAKASAITSEIRSKNPQESFFSSSLNSAISLGRNANAIYMHSGAEESSASSSYEGVGVGMLFSMPSKSFSVGSLTCKYPSPALFYSDRLEYAFNHPYEATCISMVVFYKDMQTVNIVGTKLRFKLPRKMSLFLGDFDPHNPLHMIVLEVTTASSISAIRDKVLPLIAQCR